MNCNAQQDRPNLPAAKACTPLRDLPHAKDVAERLVAELTRAETLLRQAIAPPVGHEWWSQGKDRFNWYLGDPIRSTEGGFSLHIRKAPQPGQTDKERTSDPTQISVELRLFAPACEYRDGRKRMHARHHGDDRFEAMVSVNSGPQWAFQYTRHLVEREPFVYAGTVEELCTVAAARVNAGLTRALEAVSRCSRRDAPVAT
ncbi:hypothetical protein [Paraburkholderia sp. J8-2]|uniref:hypothetical protein n=1 Tax=Paraburkholderia sp. J8-2 TaxID=2805440 RepID=UPI002AB65D11|nr:hypothetical protein [Paraburkholderia sp. J8-2]